MKKTSAIDWRFGSEKHTIERYRPIAMLYQWGLFAIGALFWLDETLRGGGFDPSVYGELAYSIPAEMWAIAMMAASSLCIIGLMKPVARHHVFLGGAIHCAFFAILVYSAIFNHGEFAVGVFASFFIVTPNLMLAWKAFEDGRR
jgi:hypothetical protein